MRRETYRGMRLGRYADDGRDPAGEATIVIGLGFGDECKGMTVAHETGRAASLGLDALNVRFNGGAQAAHNVTVRKVDGKVIHHTHSQFGSGTMLGAQTLLTRGMLVSPISLVTEADRLAQLTGDAVERRLHIEVTAPILLPMHGKANQLLERRRGQGRHGSTGLGIGIARACEAATQSGEMDPSDLMTVGTLLLQGELIRKMNLWVKWIEGRFGIDLGMDDDRIRMDAEWARDSLRVLVGRGAHVLLGDEAQRMLDERLTDDWTSVIFEGSQGILLDERYGWFPHVTYGDMTADYARERIGNGKSRILGITRCYHTRHGAGPFPSEGLFDADEQYNDDGTWTGAFRTGLLDVPLLRAGADAAKPDEVAVSCLDRWPGRYVSGWDGEEAFGECERPVPAGPVISECDGDEILGVISDACGGKPVRVLGFGEAVDDWQDAEA